MTATERRRLTVNLSVDDLTWLEKEAADEGVEPVMLLSMIVARMRQGRPALYRQALEPKIVPAVAARPQASLTEWRSAPRRDIADGPASDLADATDEYEHQYAADHFELETPRADEIAIGPADKGAARRALQQMGVIPAEPTNGSPEPAEPIAAVPLFIPERQRYNPGRQ